MDINGEFTIEEQELVAPKYEIQTENGLPKIVVTDFNDPVIEDPEQLKMLALNKPSIRQIIIPGSISFNINEISAHVHGVIANAKSLDLATADEKDVKGAQASLNSVVDDLNSSRIIAEKVYMECFNENLKEPINKLIDLVKSEKQPIAKILTDMKEVQIKARQSFINDEKIERFAKESEQVDKFLRTCPWFDDSKWLLKGTTQKAITKAIDEKATKAVNDLSALSIFSSDNLYASQVQEKYRQTGDLGESLTYQNQLIEDQKRHDQLVAEQQARAIAEKQAKEAEDARIKAERENAKSNEPIHIGYVAEPKFMQPKEPVAETSKQEVEIDLPPIEKVRDVNLTLIGVTNKQAGDLIEFFKKTGIKYKMA